MPQRALQRRGLALPAVRSAGGYFASKGPLDRAWGDLILALFVPVGSRAMRRDYGSGLHRLIFDPAVEQDDPVVLYAAQEAASRNAPPV